ncbi:MAG: sigma-70 family RNA polymerase sigma factor [Planctomycetota bacterium]
MSHTAPADRLTEDDFARLLERERDVLRVVAAGEVGRSDAEDVVQDASIVALGKLDAFRPGTDFRAWMVAFVRHTASNHRRATGRRMRRRLRIARETRDAVHAEAGGAERLDARLVEAIDGLAPDQRVCLLLRVAMSLAYDQIGAALGIPAATARSHVRRARLRLLEMFPDGEVSDG